MNTLIRFVAAAGFAAVSTGAIAASGYKYLNVALVTQEHSNWCWDASSVDVLRWYGTTQSQCGIANWAEGRSDTCGNTNFNWSSSANSPNALYGQAGSVQSILQHWGVGNNAYTSAVSWSSVVSDVNANRPFVMRFGWYGGGGHILVGYGYDDRSGTQTIGYMNPWPGEGYTWSTYSWTAYAPYDHTWTHSLRMTR